MDDGGAWQLDVIGNPRELIDQRVTLNGIRSGFDLLDVHRIWREGIPRPLAMWERVADWFNRKRKRLPGMPK